MCVYNYTYCIELYCSKVPAANAPGCIVQTLVFSLSYLHRQVSPPATVVVKRGATWARNGLWILTENTRLPRNIQGSFTCRKSTTWDKRLCLFTSFQKEGMLRIFFFALKNPTALAGFEPRNLGTKGQHATSRPSKPLRGEVTDPRLVLKSGTDGAVPAFLYVVSWRRQIQF